MYAKQEGIDPNLFRRQITQESGWNPRARSHAGAIGIAQIVPKWHPNVDPNDPDASLRYAAKHMGQLYRKYGNYQDALSVYNSGRPFKVGRGIEETRNYVAKIMSGGVVATANNQNAASKVSTGDNTAFGAPAQRSNALAGFMLQQVQRLQTGQGFDIGGLAAAVQSDRQNAAEAVHGMDQGGQDPSDPRVKVEQPSGSYRGPGGAKGMRTAIAMARKMGLHAGSNEAVTGRPETSGHTEGSDHYRYLDKGIQAAIDVSGDPKQEIAYFRWLERNRKALGLKDLFHDPMGYSYDEGKRWGQTIGGHGHVHFSSF